MLGLNYPWHGYGWDFGPTPYGEGLVRRKRDDVARALDAVATSGVTVLRWFVGYDGRNLPSPGGEVRAIARTRTYSGLGTYLERTTDDATFRAAIAPPPSFVEDLVALAALVRARGMRLFPMFVSSALLTPALPAHVTDAYVGRGRLAFVFGNRALPRRRLFGLGGHTSGVDDTRAAIGATREHVDAFVRHALAPLVDAVPADAVFAWDVMNEPEWCVRGTPYTKGHAGALVHPWMALTYLDAAIRAVARRGRDVSVGFVDGHVDAWFPGTATRPTFAAWLDAVLVGTDVTYYHQHHHYPRAPDPKPLPHARAFGLGRHPVLLGEFPLRFAAGLARGAHAAADEALQRTCPPWPDADAADERDPARYLEGRVRLAKARGYAGALGWAGPGNPDNAQSAYADGADAVARAFAQLARVATATG